MAMAGTRSAPRVFTIPAGVPFLAVLADAIVARRLVDYGDDPLDLADVTVLLPTRRSVRAFRDALVARLGGNAAILPIIRPLGDVDEEDHLLAAPPSRRSTASPCRRRSRRLPGSLR
jgi:ATP-dependent helicase/nuclease subunit B